MGLGVVCAGSAMSNPFTTELQVHQTLQRGIEAFPSQDEEGLGAAAFRLFDESSKNTIHLPFHICYFSNSSPSIIYRTLNSVLSAIFFFLNYLEGCTQGLPASSRFPDYQDPKKLFLSRQNHLSVGSAPKCFPIKLVTLRKFCYF